jgi:flagellar protein FliS
MLGLDTQRGGDIAANLERLYDYMSRTLLKANLENRVDLLKEVSSLLREVKLGWDGIAAAT